MSDGGGDEDVHGEILPAFGQCSIIPFLGIRVAGVDDGDANEDMLRTSGQCSIIYSWTSRERGLGDDWNGMVAQLPSCTESWFV
jgi:hypothetical protein